MLFIDLFTYVAPNFLRYIIYNVVCNILNTDGTTINPF